MIVYQDIPEGIKKFYNDWKADRDNFLVKVKRYSEYYFTDVENTGTTYDQRQVSVIKDNTNIPVSLNFIYPIVEQRLASMVKRKPSFQIVTSSQDPKYKQYAFVLDKAVYSLLRCSNSLSKLESHCRDVLIEGMSILGFDDEDTYYPGEFPFALNYYPNDWVILDAGSRLKEGTDMRGYFLERQIPREYAQFKFGSIIDQINEYYSTEENKLSLTIDSFGGGLTPGISPSQSIGMGEKPLQWRRFYDRVFSTMYFVRNPETEDIEFLFKENYFEDQIPFIFNNENVIGEEQGLYTRRSDILGDKLILFNVMPIRLLPIKVTYFDWGGRPYRSYGMVHREIGKQDAIDKITQMLLLNGMLQNNSGWTGPAGWLNPAQKQIWTQAANDPRVPKEYTLIAGPDGRVIEPKRDVISPLNPFYAELLVMLKNSMEYSTSHDPAVAAGLTNEGGKIDVFSTLKQYQDTRMERIELTMNQLTYTNEYLGTVAIEWLLASLKPEETYTFLDEVGSKVNEIKILKDMVKDFKLTRYKLLAVIAEAHPSQKIAMATELFKIAQTSEGSEKRVFVKKAFELLDMRGYDDLAEELSEVKKLEQMVMNLQEQIKRSEELMKQMENQKVNSEVKVKIMEKYIQAVEDLVKQKIKAEDQIQIDKLKEQLKDAKSVE